MQLSYFGKILGFKLRKVKFLFCLDYVIFRFVLLEFDVNWNNLNIVMVNISRSKIKLYEEQLELLMI